MAASGDFLMAADKDGSPSDTLDPGRLLRADAVAEIAT